MGNSEVNGKCMICKNSNTLDLRLVKVKSWTGQQKTELVVSCDSCKTNARIMLY